ncbi:MAG: CpaD family pilus assembly lipoprotein [Actinomycetota bacterium]
MNRAAALIVALAVTACTADLSEHDYRLAHPIAVEQRAAVAVFDRPVEGTDPSAFDRDRLKRIATESLKRGAGPVEIVAAEDAAPFAEALAAVLAENGLARPVVKVAKDAPAATATVRAPVWEAKAPECGTFERGLNPDWTNAPNSNWGCATQRNKALMVQNPADLVRARDASGRDGNRASDVLDKYGKGQSTGSQAEAQTQGSLSGIAGGGK